MDDESGREERFYGRLGEIVKEIKTIASDTQGDGPNSPEVRTTEYLFDTFGRLQRLVYPGGEVLSYAYDAGGNVKFAQGVGFNYLTRLEYDKFEQRRFKSTSQISTTFLEAVQKLRENHLA
ncbi:MAG TPA: RHS repeat domain-containing protein [Ramlibacter sp.]|uniref:RHS repeat domain-containing protein n=1 Tax=Ramlibacter sp. TaxID=1917967 RepID=UPI002ED4C31D